jgi:arylsulfate sulfotransferase
VRNSKAVNCLPVLILLTLVSIGCGSGNFSPPVTVIAGTSNPLVAQYALRHFHQGLTAWVEFGTDTNYGRQTSIMTNSATAPGGQVLDILVAGMLPETTYHMRAHVAWSGGEWVDQDKTFTTGALPAFQQVPQFSVAPGVLGASTTGASGVELLSLVSPSQADIPQAVVTDRQGKIIWFCPGFAVPIKPMQNGHFIVNRNYTLQEIDLACNTIRDVSVALVNQSLQAQGYSFPPVNFFHHDMLVLPNGHWIALGQIIKNFTDLPGYPGTTGVAGDILLDIDANGNVAWAWSTFDHLDVNRHLQGLPDWTHSNALVYTEDGRPTAMLLFTQKMAICCSRCVTKAGF